MKRSLKTQILRKAAVLVTALCAAASLYSVAAAPQETASSEHTATALANGPKKPNEWNSQG
ncbi:hypothetical protein SSPIM334S_07889 [Streptomyces spiroverticillatus]|nr:hypothetical protein [Streptomyces finlayi]